MVRPTHTSRRRAILAAIVREIFKQVDRKKFPKMDDAVAATSEELKRKLRDHEPGDTSQKKNPWRGLPGSKRTVYTILKEDRKRRKLELLQRHKWRLK